MFDKVISMVKAAWFASVLLLITTIAYSVIFVLIPLDWIRGKRDGRIPHAIAGWWSRTIFALIPGWRVEVSGTENIPPANQPCVIVANHESMTDIWVIYFLGMQFRWLGKESIFRIPLVGHAMRRAGYIPIHRGERSSHQTALRDSKERILSGFSMFFFPEGTRSETAELRPFKIGAFKLARDTGVPILPIVLKGAGALLKKGSAVPRAATVRVQVLPMIADDPSQSLETFAASVRSTIAAAHAKLTDSY